MHEAVNEAAERWMSEFIVVGETRETGSPDIDSFRSFRT